MPKQLTLRRTGLFAPSGFFLFASCVFFLFQGKVKGDLCGIYAEQCYAGVNVASVLADGSISACPSIRANFHQGNIYKDNFMDVWNNRFQPFRNRTWARKGQCADCSMFRYCEGNGMHLHDDEGNLLICHYNRIVEDRNS